MDDFLRLRQEQNSFNPSQATQNVHGLLDKIHERFSMTTAISTQGAQLWGNFPKNWIFGEILTPWGRWGNSGEI